MLVVDVRFVPTGKPTIVFHDRVVGIGGFGREDLPAVALELGAHQRDHVSIVSPTERCAVQRNKAFAAGNKIENGLSLVVLDLIDVGVQQQAVEFGKRFGV